MTQQQQNRRYDRIAITCERPSNDTITKIRVPDHPSLPTGQQKTIWLKMRDWVDQRMAVDGEDVGYVVIDREEGEAIEWDVRDGFETIEYMRKA